MLAIKDEPLYKALGVAASEEGRVVEDNNSAGARAKYANRAVC